MAKIIIVMISRLRTDPSPPFLAMSVAQVKKKKKSAEKYIDVSAPHRPLGVRCYTLRIPPSALTSMLNFFFACSLTRVMDIAKKDVMLVV